MFVAGIVYAEALSVGSDGKPLMTFGNSLIGCALFVVFYGSIVYYRRLHLMISKSDYVCQQAPSFYMTKPYRVISTPECFTDAKPYGYADTFGPAVLAIFMAVLL